MGKIIAIIRKSSDAQEAESQKEEVLSLIISDGYRKEEVIVVGDVEKGASAIKLDEQYLENLNKVYDLIENEDIEAVYAWAIDRIGRNEEILMQFKNRLIKKNVQLVIKNPSLKLLNNDGTVNTGVELAFTLFATMAKQEMEQKKERFARARKRNLEQGKSIGGNACLGYDIDSNRFIKINEEEAELVRMIYNMFNTGRYSTTALAKELNERGYKTKYGFEFTPVMVGNILKNETYIGGYVDEQGRRRNFPTIISREVQCKAKYILSSNNSRQLKGTKHYYFALKLIQCKECGHNYQVYNGTYHCTGNILSKREGSKHLSDCTCTTALAVNNLDGILWKLTKDFLIEEIEHGDSRLEEETMEQISVVQQKIDVLEDKMKLYDKKIEEIVEKADRELRSEDYISKRIANVNQQREKENKELVKLYEELRRLNDNLQFSNSFQKWFTGYNSISEVELQGDEKVMRDLVHRYISKVEFEKCTYNENPFYYRIDITTHKGIYTVFYNGRDRYLSRCFIREAGEETDVEFSFERIIRNDEQVTTASNERFKEFVKVFNEVAPTISDVEDMWNKLLTEDSELNKVYEVSLKDNPQRMIQYLNERIINIEKERGITKRQLREKWLMGGMEFSEFYMLYRSKHK